MENISMPISIAQHCWRDSTVFLPYRYFRRTWSNDHNQLINLIMILCVDLRHSEQ